MINEWNLEIGDTFNNLATSLLKELLPNYSEREYDFTRIVSTERA